MEAEGKAVSAGTKGSSASAWKPHCQSGCGIVPVQEETLWTDVSNLPRKSAARTHQRGHKLRGKTFL